MRISYLVTLQWRSGGSPVASHYSGTADVPEGTSRTELRREIIAAAERDLGVTGTAVVLNCSIERDEL